MSLSSTLCTLAAAATFALGSPTFAQDCLDLNVDNLIGGDVATFSVSGGTPGSPVGFAYGVELGETTIDSRRLCATFGITGARPKGVLGTTRFDADGNASIRRRIPGGTSGFTFLFQAAEFLTCPDECVSNIVEQTVG